MVPEAADGEPVPRTAGRRKTLPGSREGMDATRAHAGSAAFRVAGPPEQRRGISRGNPAHAGGAGGTQDAGERVARYFRTEKNRTGIAGAEPVAGTPRGGAHGGAY